MTIPLQYNLRSMRVRHTGTVMTMLGIGLTVSIVVTMMALVQGLEATFVETGRDNQLVVIRQGSMNEVNSFFGRDLFQTVRFLPGIVPDNAGRPLACAELVAILNLPKVDGNPSNVIIRGTSQTGFHLRPEVRLAEGRLFRGGLREIIVSRSVSERFAGMELGSSVEFARSHWKVVGIFDAGGTAYDSEIWTEYTDLSSDLDRQYYSSILLRAVGAAAAEDIQRRVAEDRRVNLQAIPQKEYFADQAGTSAGVRALGWFIAMVMGVGAAFAAMNMMYGAVMARASEVATLRILGFQRGHIMTSFLLESWLLGLGGGIVGCLLALPMNGISTGTASFQTFSEVLFNFRITPGILARGMAFASFVAVLGGFLPARRAAYVDLLHIMRE